MLEGIASLVRAPSSVKGQKVDAYMGVHVEVKGTKGDSLRMDLRSRGEQSLTGQISRAGVHYDIEFVRF